MSITTDLMGKQHTILLCADSDIDTHFEKIKDAIPEEEVIEFKKRMSACIAAGSAYVLSDGSCFIYYLNFEPAKATGIALYGKNEPLKMLALFSGVFRDLDPDTFKMEFHLHAGKFIREYKSILTETSIKRHITPGHPLVIRIDKIKSKIHALHKSRGLVWEPY